MINCKQLNDDAGDYLAKDLPLSKRITVFIHILMCVHCRCYVKQLKVSLESLRRIARQQESHLAGPSETEIEETVKKLLDCDKSQ